MFYRVGDRIFSVNERVLDGVTREEAVEVLLGLSEEVTLGLL